MKQDILTHTDESLSIEVVAGKINSFRNKNITKKSARIFENGSIYSTSFVGDISNDELLKKAHASKNVGIPYDYIPPDFVDHKTIDEESLKAPLHSIQDYIEQTITGLQKFSNEFVFNGKFVRTITTTILEDEQGRKLERKFATNDWYYLYKRVGSPQLMDGYFEESGRDLDPMDVLEKNIPYLDAYPREISFQGGRYPVLFLESRMLLSKLSESFIAEKYCEGSAIYSGQLGKSIFNKDLSLYDVSYSPAHGLYGRFDSEGIVRPFDRLPLIERGVMKNVITDLRTAKKYSMDITGNGLRTPETPVAAGFHSLTLGAGKNTTQEILKKLDKCVVVFMGYGGDYTDKGDFSTPLQLSFLLEKGEIVGRLPQLTVNSSVSEMFGSCLIEVASDSFQKNTMQPSIFIEMDIALN